MLKSYLISRHEPVLITGSNGFIGCKVIALLERGFFNLRCFVRTSGKLNRLNEVLTRHPEAKIEVIEGNLLSREDCGGAVRDVPLIYHLAAGIDKSFAGAFMNSVLTTRNLLDAVLEKGLLKRFVNVSSFAVYSNRNLRRGAVLDECCEIEDPPHGRGDAYAYAKIKQDKIVLDYYQKNGLRCVIVRPGAVYGPGKLSLTGRMGIDTFGVYVHLAARGRNMPKSHQAHLEWTPSRLIHWAATAGPATAEVVRTILESRPHPEMGYRACLGIMRLAKTYSTERVEAASRRALQLQACSYTSLQSILKRSLDHQTTIDAEPIRPGPQHENLRGAGY